MQLIVPTPSVASVTALQTTVTNLNRTIQTSSPIAGATVQVTDSDEDIALYLTPAGALATLTINLPSNVNSRLGQIVQVGSTQGVTTPTFGGAATIYNAPSIINAGEMYEFQKVAADTWMQIV